MSHPVADYLHDLYHISGVSVPETSGYPALSKLLNAVGDSLKPKIIAVIHPSNNGAGIPDGGLFPALMGWSIELKFELPKRFCIR